MIESKKDYLFYIKEDQKAVKNSTQLPVSYEKQSITLMFLVRNH